MSTLFGDYRADVRLSNGLSSNGITASSHRFMHERAAIWVQAHVAAAPRKIHLSLFTPVKHAMQAIYHQIIDQQINTEV